MRLYSPPHNSAPRFYCGVDLHARTMYTHVVDARGTTVLDQNLPAHPDAFRDAVAPFRDGLVGCECRCGDRGARSRAAQGPRVH